MRSTPWIRDHPAVLLTAVLLTAAVPTLLCMRGSTPPAKGVAPLPAHKTPAATPAGAVSAPAGKWEGPIAFSGDVIRPSDKKKTHGAGRLFVYLPPQYDGKTALPLAVALHGWNHPPEYWRDKSDIARLADRYGVVVACPDMGKTIYETDFFPETKGAWSTVPGTPWLLDVVLPYIHDNFRVRTEPRYNAILGYSTGGRGAVVALERGADFGFCASLSGTYDLMTLAPGTGEYKIHAVVYGERDKFPKRWAAEGCVDGAFAGRFARTQVYIGHGAKDRVVNPDQAESARTYLRQNHIPYSVDIDAGAGHDWAFWNSRLGTAFTGMDRRFHAMACENCHLEAKQEDAPKEGGSDRPAGDTAK